MAFSINRITGLNVMANPGRVQAFSAKTEAEAVTVSIRRNLLTLKAGF